MRETITQGSYLTLENSLYPASKLFKPERLDPAVTPLTVGAVAKRFLEILGQPIPLTREESNRQFPPKEGSVSDFDDEKISNWKQVGIYWVRQTEGPHPQCHCTDRLGARARWRDAPGSYCCHGFPYFSPETMERFRKDFELLKPVLRIRLGADKYMLLSLQRTLEGAIGTCWGIRTKAIFWRVEVGGEATVIPTTKAALNRALRAHLPSRKPTAHASS